MRLDDSSLYVLKEHWSPDCPREEPVEEAVAVEVSYLKAA